MTSIWWIRRDLRLADNTALTAALDAGGSVIPVFILDEHLLSAPAEKRHAFLMGGLRSLQADLRKRNSDLIIRRGRPEEEIPRIVEEASATGVTAEADITPYARKRDEIVGRLVELRLTQGLGMHPMGAIAKADGSPYTIFTPYSKAWKALPLDGHTLPAPTQLPPVLQLRSDPIPEMPVPEDFQPGEAEAQRRLEMFINGAMIDYTEDRNQMGLEGTSGLSPYLRFGMLSARAAVLGAMKVAEQTKEPRTRKGSESWVNELIWREFYQSILYHFPNVLQESFSPRFRGLTWRNAPDELLAWREGQTGYPVVDAGMRQLAATGWMHNRARMIVASFLVKHLLINWQEGERWFMRMLVDGDPAANNGGWQWVAGTGTDAAPYFRVFNPVLQGKKFDPEGIYVRRWVPELANLPDTFIHEPWLLSPGDRPKHYPAPIVEHAFARQRALDVYSRVART